MKTNKLLLVTPAVIPCVAGAWGLGDALKKVDNAD